MQLQMLVAEPTQRDYGHTTAACTCTQGDCIPRVLLERLQGSGHVSVESWRVRYGFLPEITAAVAGCDGDG